jgi:putative ATP-dependent endonuclease of the OLD family
LFVDAQRTRSVTDTSTGNANVIYLGLLLERLSARRFGGDVVDYVLAVEEPEAHIHPVLQRQLFRYLISDETSLVVSTHSPHIAAVTQLDALILLRRDPDDSSTIASSAAGAELDVKQRADIQRYLDVSRAELLFCAAAILVEGVAEVYLLPALARALEFDLDAYGVIIANVSGTDFAPYRRVLASNALSVPHAIVTDGDPTTKKGKYVLAGLKRAAALFPQGATHDFAIAVIDALIELGPEVDITCARLNAADQQVYVGVRTLEVDIAPLLLIR